MQENGISAYVSFNPFWPPHVPLICPWFKEIVWYYISYALLPIVCILYTMVQLNVLLFIYRNNIVHNCIWKSSIVFRLNSKPIVTVNGIWFTAPKAVINSPRVVINGIEKLTELLWIKSQLPKYFPQLSLLNVPHTHKFLLVIWCLHLRYIKRLSKLVNDGFHTNLNKITCCQVVHARIHV